jgi:hypothetical protein
MKLGLLLCSKELQFQHIFQYDWFIFEWVMPPELRRNLRDFQFSGLFFAIFAAVALKRSLLLFCKELQFQFAFRCDWFIFARVTPLELRRIRIFKEIFSFL